MSQQRFAYLGPEGTFAEAALRSLPVATMADRVPYGSVPAALDAVRDGEVDAALVPLENSVEGSVAVTLDELAFGPPLIVAAEVLLPVRLALLALPGTRLQDVARVVTHPHAAAQCRRWLAAHLPSAAVLLATSTAAGAAEVAESESAHDAAIAAPMAAERHRLAVLADGIGDNPHAVTRFVLVTRPAAPPPATGADCTSVVAFITDDHPGALLEILTEFAVRGVNLSRIESRPTGEGLGRYCFFIDCEGHVAEARVGEALAGLKRACAGVRFLGSYPRAVHPEGAAGPPAPLPLRRGTSDAEFTAAAAWLASVRAGGPHGVQL